MGLQKKKHNFSKFTLLFLSSTFLHLKIMNVFLKLKLFFRSDATEEMLNFLL